VTLSLLDTLIVLVTYLLTYLYLFLADQLWFMTCIREEEEEQCLHGMAELLCVADMDSSKRLRSVSTSAFVKPCLLSLTRSSAVAERPCSALCH